MTETLTLDSVYATVTCPEELDGMIRGISGEYGTPPADWISQGDVTHLRVALETWKKSGNKPELVK